jgi:hypothetical protein
MPVHEEAAMSSPHEDSDHAEQRMLGAVPGAPALGRCSASNGAFLAP